MKIQYLSRYIRLTKALGLENQGQVREFYEREREAGESVWQTINRYYRELMEVEL